jgi:hypothetical protein
VKNTILLFTLSFVIFLYFRIYHFRQNSAHACSENG